jgi:probable rRNA maturation factor
MQKQTKISITVQFFTSHPALNRREITKTLKKILNLADVVADEVSIAFTDDLQISEYNKTYLNREGATDVLSFTYNELNEEGKYNLGDIVISIETAVRQAEELGHSVEYEINTLMTHAVLHLVGYDHEVDSGEMQADQDRIMDIISKDKTRGADKRG